MEVIRCNANNCSYAINKGTGNLALAYQELAAHAKTEHPDPRLPWNETRRLEVVKMGNKDEGDDRQGGSDHDPAQDTNTPHGTGRMKNLADCIQRVMKQGQQKQNEVGTGKHYSRPFTVVIEGNIGSGKSTFLEMFRRWSDKIKLLPEPVDAWRDLNGHNLLDHMYKQPGCWSLPFQIFAQLTFIMNHTAESDRPIKMMERSVHSAMNCFVENHKRNGVIIDYEFEILNAWYKFLNANKGMDLGVDLTIYLRTDPEVALERLKGRNRGEEQHIPIKYIEQLHALHEEWLVKDERGPPPAPQVIVVDANMELNEMEAVFQGMKEELSKSEKKGGRGVVNKGKEADYSHLSENQETTDKKAPMEGNLTEDDAQPDSTTPDLDMEEVAPKTRMGIKYDYDEGFKQGARKEATKDLTQAKAEGGARPADYRSNRGAKQDHVANKKHADKDGINKSRKQGTRLRMVDEDTANFTTVRDALTHQNKSKDE